jgi:hypothetical protein
MGIIRPAESPEHELKESDVNVSDLKEQDMMRDLREGHALLHCGSSLLSLLNSCIITFLYV